MITGVCACGHVVGQHPVRPRTAACTICPCEAFDWAGWADRVAAPRAPAAADYRPSIPDPEQARARLEALSPAESEVLALLARGWTVAEVADRRFVTVPTIRSQVKSLRKKLGVDSVVEAVVIVHRAGGAQHCGPRLALAEAAS